MRFLAGQPGFRDLPADHSGRRGISGEKGDD